MLADADKEFHLSYPPSSAKSRWRMQVHANTNLKQHPPFYWKRMNKFIENAARGTPSLG
jgi:hypothetical protein